MPDPKVWPPRCDGCDSPLTEPGTIVKLHLCATCSGTDRTEQLEAILKRTGLHVEDHDGVTLWCFKGGAGSVRLDEDEAALLCGLKSEGHADA